MLEAKVSLENKSATITYNPNHVSLDKIKQSINETGYKAGAPKKITSMNLEHFLNEFIVAFQDGSVLSLGLAFMELLHLTRGIIK